MKVKYAAAALCTASVGTLLSVFCVSLLTFSTPARAVVLFNNPLDSTAAQTFWCDPCSSGNVGYRVWDSFTLANNSTLTSLQWIGLRTDDMSLGIDLEIANTPYRTDLFSASYASGSISRVNTGVRSSANKVSLPDLVLSAGTYWLTVHGPSITETLTWLGQVEAGGDNSLIQFGPDPNNPTQIIPRFQDARFLLRGTINPTPTPLPAALPLFATGLGVIGFLAKRRKRKGATAA
jgi:hypothetical protein